MAEASAGRAHTRPDHAVGLSEAFRTWAKVALNSFGGPAGQIAVMHRFLVEERRWISEGRFLHALNYCMLLPGPEAQQLAVYIGWLMHGVPGGVMAGVLFVIPGVVAILALSLLYVASQGLGILAGLFFGLQAAVVAVVAEAVLRIGRRALKNRFMLALAALAFVAIFFFEVPFPLIVAAAGVVGYLGGNLRPELFSAGGHGSAPRDDGTGAIINDSSRGPARAAASQALRAALVALVLWLLPVGVLLVGLGPANTFTREAVFFSQAAVVTFGGAYSVLAYIAQQAVETYGWLRPEEMLTGLGLAETTPGPLIMVVQFVGFLASYRNPGALSPLAAAVAGSLLTTWVTFVPCFFFIFLGAPFIERLRGNRQLNAALSGITAAVVGVVLNLAVWFTINTAFERVSEVRVAGVRLLVPDLATVNPAAVLLAVGAAVAIFRYRIGVIPTLAAGAVLGMLLFAVSATPSL